MPVDEQAADSSTAVDEASAAALAENDFERYSQIENAREHAAKNGTALTEVPPASEKPASETPAAESETAKPAQETAAERAPKNAETRKAELKAEIDELLKQRAELKAKPEGEKRADPPPARQNPEAPKKPTLPDLKDYETLAEFQAAERQYAADQEKYITDLVDFKISQDRAAQAAEAANKVYETALTESKNAARAEFPDFDEVALSPKLPLSKAMDGWLLKHINLAGGIAMKVLYRLGENDAAEAKRIIALDAFDQVDALAEIRATFKAAAKPPAPVKKQTTAAPAPATDLGGRSSEPADKVQAALLTNDYPLYEREANARDAKAMRG